MASALDADDSLWADQEAGVVDPPGAIAGLRRGTLL
jgi:hypothetical protein